jgi:hypothetical protein
MDIWFSKVDLHSERAHQTKVDLHSERAYQTNDDLHSERAYQIHVLQIEPFEQEFSVN